MKLGLSRKLALGNVIKNYRFFIPRILTETGLLACFYIVFTLACDGRLSEVRGGNYLPTFMWMGTVVIGLLSAVLMLYTNSFLMKQRKREFGLYTVLGMEKKHVCRVLFHESALCSLISVAAGLPVGVLFYKLSALLVCRLLQAPAVSGFYFITPATLLPAGAIFAAIDFITFLFNCADICRMKLTELLASARTGEREPKIRWLLLVLGVLCLGGGYGISLCVKNPLQAILLFFAAVLLVIAGTYFLFVAGSVFVLKLLKKRESFYYRPGRITAVSGLLYRMKQNAVGLASVAVLATGVLIMTSTTFCLYFRAETTLKDNYPQDYYVSTVFTDENGQSVRLPDETVAAAVRSAAEKHGLKIKEEFSQEYFDVAFSRQPGALITDRASVAVEESLSSLCSITFITEETYVKLGGSPLGLKSDEVAVCPYNLQGKFGDAVFTLCGREYRTAQTLTFFPIRSAMISVNCFGMVVADQEIFDEIFAGQQAAYGDNASDLVSRWCVTFDDREQALKNGPVFDAETLRILEDEIRAAGCGHYTPGGSDAFWHGRESLYGMYGTLLFLGILLGLVCLFATVLIIYYKQISEGYEDRGRYQIMRKIGMTDREVRGTIRSQILLVFFLPLITAGIHTVFAFPILTRLMEILLLDNAGLFAGWCLIVYAAFAAVYTLIYRLTAKTYYKIVY